MSVFLKTVLGLITGAAIALVFCLCIWGMLNSIQNDAAQAPLLFNAAQCSVVPTGREHEKGFEVRDQNGVGIGVNRIAVSHEWITICEKSEWR